MKRMWIGTVALALGCGSSTSGTDSGPPADSGSGGNDASSMDAGNNNNDGGDDGGGGNGSGTVMGSADGTPFTTVATSLWIGMPDSAQTTVVFVFSKPVKCSEVTMPGWDTRITQSTQFLEMKMFGLTPMTYKVVTTLTPAPGEASVNYTLSTQMGVPKETSGTGGTVTLAAINAMKNATGAFNLNFGNNTVSGTYDAAYCASGVEP